MRFLPVSLPFAIFLLLLLPAVFRALRFLLRVRATVSDGQLGKAVHLETPLGTIDVKPQQGPDPDLASIPKYPGAIPSRDLTATRYEADVHLTGHAGRYVSETFRTDDPAGMVSDFYKRELPDWQQDRFYEHGFRFIREDAAGQRAITIQPLGHRTTIQYAVVHTNQETTGTGTISGTTFASDSNFGVLR